MFEEDVGGGRIFLFRVRLDVPQLILSLFSYCFLLRFVGGVCGVDSKFGFSQILARPRCCLVQFVHGR